MRLYITLICFVLCMSLKAQVEPILDYTWTIEKIVTDHGETIMADLNPFGDYDTLTIILGFEYENSTLYYTLFGGCEYYISYDDDSEQMYFILLGCVLSNESSEIAIYFNGLFIAENTNETTIDNEFFPFAFGPLDYSFRTEEDIIYLDITNSIGEVATFYATNLSQEEFLKESISIYPNPTIEVLNIESSGVAIENVKIYDINGRLVKEIKINDESQINVSQLQKGVYIIEMKTSMGVLRKKLIKQ